MGTFLFNAGRLVMRAGKFVYTTCAACCGPCITFWKAIPCPSRPIAPFDPCGPQQDPPPPDPIYVRTDAICLARQIRPGDTIYVDGHCYTVVNLRFRRAQDSCAFPPIPSGARVVDTAPCLAEGCANELCRQAFRGWGIASYCGGQGDLPPIYFCQALLTTCVIVDLHDITGGEHRCIRLDPNGAQAAPSAGAFVITTLDGIPTYSTCCQCESLVSSFPCEYCRPISSEQSPGQQPTTTEGAPCCYDKRQPCAIRVSGEFESWDAISNGQLYTHTTIPPQVVSCTAGTIIYTREVYENGVRVFGPTDEPGAAPVWDACSRVSIDYQIGFRTDATVSVRSSCTETRVTWLIGTPGSNGSTIANFTMTLQPQAYQAPCAGRCGSSSLGAGNLFPGPLPFSEWPSAAKLLSLSKQPGEVGLGDTIERLAGKTGAAFKATAKALGIDCGCAKRRDSLNAFYPYQ